MRAIYIIWAVALLLFVTSSTSTLAERSRPTVKIIRKPSAKALLPVLPVQAELSHLGGTLGAMANAEGRRRNLLMQKVQENYISTNMTGL